MEKKDGTGLRTAVALMLLLLFFFAKGAIVVITKMEGFSLICSWHLALAWRKKSFSRESFAICGDCPDREGCPTVDAVWSKNPEEKVRLCGRS